MIQNSILRLAAIGIVSLAAAHSALADVGIRGGYGYSLAQYQSGGATVPGVSSKGNYLVGLAGENKFGPFVIITDVLYSKRTVGFAEGSQTFTYLETPLMAGFQVGFIRVTGGAYYAFGLGKIRSCSSGSCLSHAYESSPVEIGSAGMTYRKADYGLMGAVGVVLPIPNVNISFDLRYRHGMANVSGIESVDAKWRTVDLVAGITF